LSHAHLSMLLEGIDWRRPIRTAAPSLAVWNISFPKTFAYLHAIVKSQALNFLQSLSYFPT
jgi:hypothetical protein